MKPSNGQSLPKARKHDLVTRQIPGELLVYDLKRHKAFCLNETAATVWKNCNGRRTVAELAAELERGQSIPVDEQVVWLALDQLREVKPLTNNGCQANQLTSNFAPELAPRRHCYRDHLATRHDDYYAHSSAGRLADHVGGLQQT